MLGNLEFDICLAVCAICVLGVGYSLGFTIGVKKTMALFTTMIDKTINKNGDKNNG